MKNSQGSRFIISFIFFFPSLRIHARATTSPRPATSPTYHLTQVDFQTTSEIL